MIVNFVKKHIRINDVRFFTVLIYYILQFFLRTMLKNMEKALPYGNKRGTVAIGLVFFIGVFEARNEPTPRHHYSP